MAFNPLQTFEKHQKAWMAGIIIVCMLVFMAQFGAGDLFQRGLAYFGGRAAKGQPVAVIDGEKIYEIDLDNLRKQRKLVNDFVAEGFRDAKQPVLGVFFQGQGKITQELFKRATEEEKTRKMHPALRALVELQRHEDQALQFGLSRQVIGELRLQCQNSILGLQTVAAIMNAKDDSNKKLIDQVAILLSGKMWNYEQLTEERPEVFQPRFYFGGGTQAEDLLDFMVWKKQAQKLGIQLTDEGVLQEINREMAYADEIQATSASSFETDKLVVGMLQRVRQDATTTPATLLQALREEFQVALAQAILLGKEPGVRGGRGALAVNSRPVTFGPWEFYNFMREQRTTVDVQMLRIPVNPFLKKVQGTPTAEELRNRYEKYKDQVPDPAKPEPGFREPRRVQFEYVSVSPRDPYYRDRARDLINKLAAIYAAPPPQATETHNLARTRVGAALSANIPGAGLLGNLATTSFGLTFDPLVKRHETYIQTPPNWLSPPARLPTDVYLHDGSTYYARHAAALLGILSAGPNPVASNPFLTSATWYGTGTVQQIKDAQRFTATYLLAETGHAPHLPALGTMMSSFALSANHVPWVPKQWEVRSVLESEQAYVLAEGFVRENLTEVRQALPATTSFLRLLDIAQPTSGQLDPNMRWAQEMVIRDLVKKHHLSRRKMPEPLSEKELVDQLRRDYNLNLSELRQAHKDMHTQDFKEVLRFRNVDDNLLVMDLWNLSNQNFEPRDSLIIRFNNNLQPVPLMQLSTQRSFLVWRSDDVMPQDQRDLQRNKRLQTLVTEAWKLERARGLARQAAEQVISQIQARNTSGKIAPEQLTQMLHQQAQLHTKEKWTTFKLSQVARLVPPEREPLAFSRTEYRPYAIPTDLIPQIPYAPETLVAQVQKLSSGQATLLTDRAGRDYYVALVTKRTVPTREEFQEIYHRTPRADTLFDHLMETQFKNFKTEQIKQLRLESAPQHIQDDGSWKLTDEVRTRFEGRSSFLE